MHNVTVTSCIEMQTVQLTEYMMITAHKTSVTRLWIPRVSPCHKCKFQGGGEGGGAEEFFHMLCM